MDIEKLEQIIKLHLSDKRFNHVKNVAEEAVRLAAKYGVDVEKARIAGLLHDITKEFEKEEHLYLFNQAMLKLDPIEAKMEKVWYPISGAIYAEKVLDIKDQDILNAIRYHLTGRIGMSKLEKIIFVADYTSCERNFDGVDKIRYEVDRSLERGVVEEMKFTLPKLISLESPICEDGWKAYNYYVALKNKGERL